jgi:hypothetical protein
MRILFVIIALFACGGAISAHASDSASPAQGPSATKVMPSKQVKCILSNETTGAEAAAASAASAKKTCTYSCAGMDMKPTETIALKQTCPPTMMHTIAP